MGFYKYTDYTAKHVLFI